MSAIDRIYDRIKFINAEMATILDTGGDTDSIRFKYLKITLDDLQRQLIPLNNQMGTFAESTKAAGESAEVLADPLQEIVVSARKFNQDFDLSAIESVAESAKYAADGLLAFQERLDLLDTAFALGLITAEQFNAELKNMIDTTDALQDVEVSVRFSKDILEGIDKPKDKILTALAEIKQASEGFVTDFTNTLVDGLAEGELRFKDFAENVLKTIAKMMLNKVFTSFLNSMFGSIGTQSGVNNLLGQPGLFAAPAPVPAGPTTRFGAGGIGQQMNVGVLTQPSYGYGGGSSRRSGVNINVNNNAPVDVEVQQRENSNGGIDIDMIIENKVAKSIANGGLDKPLNSAFGLARRAW